jgi:hypothetical protein
MEGVKGACDSLLSPYGISVNFDTVTSLMGNLSQGTTSYNGPLGAVFRRHRLMVYNRGASLDLFGSHASPVLTGRAWHSDAGSRSNEAGAFIGDEKWSAGDRLGGSVLVASYGGWFPSLVVFGDTSPFIDRNVPYNAEFILDLFRVLRARPQLDPALAWIMVGLIVVLALALLDRVGQGAGGRACPRTRAALFSFLPAAIVLSALLRLQCPPPPPSGPVPNAPALVVSTQEQNLFSRDPFSDESVASLARIAEESGFLCSVGPWRDRPRVECLVIVNPTRPLGMEMLIQKIEAGGRVIVSGGAENPYFLEVLSHFGCSPCGPPLGRIQGEEFDSVSACEISHVDPGPREDFYVAGRLVGTRVRVGNGTITLLADSALFWSGNLRDHDASGEKNARFIGRLLRD